MSVADDLTRIHEKFYGAGERNKNNLFGGGNAGNALLGFYLREGLETLAKALSNMTITIKIQKEEINGNNQTN